ncbi:ABC transporter permease [Consotaella salsifontis]|uniref:Monosaccharide ABC transporter membrane protein, CUT2 family n=1 Tax=Consotaella salsifontis TaxID=1365950 RepID=A0A1T4SHX5_9HYPH|nr:sugar ABC transporter permease [Consotaella salsifontis]SKA27910.1 monosaccharide ABC transporter membrane protein, CUT2 family [Consotaella salsifontis]
MQTGSRAGTNPLAMREYGIVFAFIGLCILVGALCQLKVVQGTWPQNAFLTVNNLLLILHQISVNGVLAVGMTFVIISGGIDLSVGSLLAFSGMMAASFATRSPGVTAWAGNYGAFIPIVVALAVGSASGALNGWIISRFKIQAFIATLGMLMAGRGFTMAVTNGNPISALGPEFRWFGTGKLFDAIPIPAVILGIVFLLAWIILNKTVFGRYVYAVGGNEKSARTSGINTKAILIWVYVLSGFLAGVAGVILTAKTGSAQTAAGTSYELDAIAAVVIGGASLSGGIGRLTGTFFGALIIGVMNNGLDILGVQSFYQLIIKGSLIVFAVILDPSRKLTA